MMTALRLRSRAQGNRHDRSRRPVRGRSCGWQRWRRWRRFLETSTSKVLVGKSLKVPPPLSPPPPDEQRTAPSGARRWVSAMVRSGPTRPPPVTAAPLASVSTVTS
jgi:hypothetical protein